jgi:hypothetical protein
MRQAAFANVGTLRSFLARRHFLVQHCVTPVLTADFVEKLLLDRLAIS